MATPSPLLPFQRFAQEWKDKIARRAQEDLELSTHFAEQRAAKEQLLASRIAVLDTSKEIETQTVAKVESAKRRLEEQIAALKGAHWEEVQAIEMWKEKKIEENEGRIREGKTEFEAQERGREEEWERMRGKLRGLREREDEEARRTSMVLLEEEGLRLGDSTPERSSIVVTTATSSATKRTGRKQPGRTGVIPTAATGVQKRGRPRKSIEGTQLRFSGPAVLTPSTSPSQQQPQDVDSGVDELQDDEQLTNSNPRKRHRLEDLPPLTSSAGSASKTPRTSKIFDLHAQKTAVVNASDGNSEDERLY